MLGIIITGCYILCLIYKSAAIAKSRISAVITNRHINELNTFATDVAISDLVFELAKQYFMFHFDYSWLYVHCLSSRNVESSQSSTLYYRVLYNFIVII